MADIVLTCPECGEQTTVSEYVDPAKATCRACGNQLRVPGQFVTQPRAAAPLAKREEKPHPAPAKAGRIPERDTITAFKVVENRRSRKRQRKSLTWTPSTIGIFSSFVILASVLLFLRWGGVLSHDRLDAYRMIGVYGVLIAHVAVVVDAFNDSVMYGLLCLFVPFYSLFYVYTESDSFILRLVVAVFVVPFGLDTLVVLRDVLVAGLGALKIWSGSW